MTAFGDVDERPYEFRRALAELRAIALRPEIRLDDTPAPKRLAPYAHALVADVVVDDEELATGRFVLLHDPEGPDAWDGVFRIVSLVRAEIEPETAADPLLPEVGWSWLLDALGSRDAAHTAASGTVTRLAEESFGLDREPTAKVEIRASWTPLPGAAGDPAIAATPATPAAPVTDAGGLGLHLSAWSDVLCQAAGLPPVPPGVAVLKHR